MGITTSNITLEREFLAYLKTLQGSLPDGQVKTGILDFDTSSSLFTTALKNASKNKISDAQNKCRSIFFRSRNNKDLSDADTVSLIGANLLNLALTVEMIKSTFRKIKRHSPNLLEMSYEERWQFAELWKELEETKANLKNHAVNETFKNAVKQQNLKELLLPAAQYYHALIQTIDISYEEIVNMLIKLRDDVRVKFHANQTPDDGWSDWKHLLAASPFIIEQELLDYFDITTEQKNYVRDEHSTTATYRYFLMKIHQKAHLATYRDETKYNKVLVGHSEKLAALLEATEALNNLFEQRLGRLNNSLTILLIEIQKEIAITFDLIKQGWVDDDHQCFLLGSWREFKKPGFQAAINALSQKTDSNLNNFETTYNNARENFNNTVLQKRRDVRRQLNGANGLLKRFERLAGYFAETVNEPEEFTNAIRAQITEIENMVARVLDPTGAILDLPQFIAEKEGKLQILEQARQLSELYKRFQKLEAACRDVQTTQGIGRRPSRTLTFLGNKNHNGGHKLTGGLIMTIREHMKSIQRARRMLLDPENIIDDVREIIANKITVLETLEPAFQTTVENQLQV